MPPPKENPKYIYKIVETEPPTPLPAVFPPLALDKQDGFIHLSTARQVRTSTESTPTPPLSPLTRPTQVPLTASRFFATHQTLYLLKVRLANNPQTAPHTKWETAPHSNADTAGEDDFFPHLYGSFGAADIEAVRKVERRAGEEGKVEGEGWQQVFAKGEEGKWLA